MFRLVESYKSFGARLPLEIPRNSSTIFRSNHRRCSIKKAFLKHFVIFTGKHLGLFFNKVAGHQSCSFIKKRLQHSIFLWISEICNTILNNICQRLHFWKVFYKNIFTSQLSKENFWWNKIDHLLCERLLKLVKIEQICFLGEERKN